MIYECHSIRAQINLDSFSQIALNWHATNAHWSLDSNSLQTQARTVIMIVDNNTNVAYLLSATVITIDASPNGNNDVYFWCSARFSISIKSLRSLLFTRIRAHWHNLFHCDWLKHMRNYRLFVINSIYFQQNDERRRVVSTVSKNRMKWKRN